MNKPVLEMRGTSIVGWIESSWPFGYLQIHEDYIEVAPQVMKKENIISIRYGFFRKFLVLWLPCAVVFRYRDPFDLRNGFFFHPSPFTPRAPMC